MRHRDFLGIGDELGPEPAAHRRRDDANPACLAAQHARDQVAPGVRRLGRTPYRDHAVGRVVAGKRAPAFDRMPAAAMYRQTLGEHAVRPDKGGLDIAELHGELRQEIVLGAAMDRRRAGRERVAAVRDDGKRFVGYVDQRRRVLRRIARLGDDHRHRLADMDDLVVGEDGPVALLPIGRARQADDQAVGREMGAEIGERPHRMDAGCRHGRALVDPGNRGMRQRAPHESRVEGSRQVDVVDETCLPAQQGRILDPCIRHLLPAAGRGCRGISACRSGRR